MHSRSLQPKFPKWALWTPLMPLMTSMAFWTMSLSCASLLLCSTVNANYEVIACSALCRESCISVLLFSKGMVFVVGASEMVVLVVLWGWAPAKWSYIAGG